MAKDKIVSEIYETYDYGKFTPLVQNRGVANKKGIKPNKMKKLIKLFENNEWVPELGAIKVNKELKVIDGHHRLALLEQLQLPVWYQIVEHERFNQVTNREFLNNTYKTNQVRTDWTNKDFFKAAVQSKAPLAITIDQIIRNNMNYFSYVDMLAIIMKDASLFVKMPNELKTLQLFEQQSLIEYTKTKEFREELEDFILINNKVRLAPYRNKILGIIYEVVFNATQSVKVDKFKKIIASVPDRTLQGTKNTAKDDILRIFLQYYNSRTQAGVKLKSILEEIKESKALIHKFEEETDKDGDKTA